MVAVAQGEAGVVGFELDREQREAVQMMLRPESEGACLNGSDMGTGKTATSLAFCQAFRAKTVLIIAPLQTLDGWAAHMGLLGYDLPFRQITSDKAGKEAYADYQWGIDGVYFVGHELFVRMGRAKEQVFNKDGSPRLKNEKPTYRYAYTKAWEAPMDVVIFDEIHRGQNPTSGTHDVLMKMATPRYKIGASGTPTGNSFDGAYAVTKWLWPHRAEKNIYLWRQKWAEVIYDHFAVRNQKVVDELNPGAYFKSLPCYFRIESDLDIEVDDQKVWVNLYPEQKRVYDELEESMVAWIKDHPMVTKLPVTKRTRQRQATLALPSLEQVWNEKTGEWDTNVYFEEDAVSAKVDRLWDVLDTDFKGEPALIFTDSQQFAQILAMRMNTRYGREVAKEWSGKIPRKRRGEIKDEFIQGDLQYLVAVIKASGTGTDGLQLAASNMIYMSIDDSRIENEQSLARLVRRGQKSLLVRVRRILARETIDEGQFSNQVQAALRMNKILRKKGANR